ncbi:UNVERIFIED_CONTAM: hypothetical protein Sradi_4401000 [Sesamum radiatum]|uniref:Reverse transcriptase domain-containing protein n=1 Tax=Sesamum radiatum TaxID=300843 RepID=A0AAW2NQD3_SESRA
MGFFLGAKGLRQGYPMSPYLFVIAMVLHLLLAQRVDQSENFCYHWHCKEIGLVNLCFFDDLLFFCRAELPSVHLFREALLVFAAWTGLEANPSKSQLIVSKAAMDVRQQLLSVLGFQEGALPVRYLGIPLISSRLTTADCSALIRKIDERLNGWGKLQLSFAARTQDRVGVDYKRQCRIMELEEDSTTLGHVQYKVGTGSHTMLWHDPWYELGVLIHQFPRGPQVLGIPAEAKLDTVIKDWRWDWLEIFDIEHREITHQLPLLTAEGTISWNSPTGQLNTAAAFCIWSPPGSEGNMAPPPYRTVPNTTKFFYTLVSDIGKALYTR